MAHLRGLLVLLALWLYRLGRCVLAGFGLASLLSPWAAAVLVLCCVALQLQWALRLLAVFALWRLWHWPLWVALLAAAPRLVLILPGLITTGLARWRHPRPRWSAPARPSLRIPTGS